ncbi:transcription elongation factor A N-terminal and central domain-containing protein [Bufo gargarizans]|uniref:transcription elongation factor A N-terminal and central domain-containing protein n=1 Tax=Bufo gargarizans TaxID=30331 RepID=UPI001CF5E5AF|nr:transcription elongation factor A N-terminal and central domain-containing protein [Bufo gargarizans]
MLDSAGIKELTFRALQVESLLSDRMYEDIAYHFSYFEEAKVNWENLQQTDAVRVVYRVLKSCPPGALKKKAKCLLSKWKLLYKDSAAPESFTGEQEMADSTTQDLTDLESPSSHTSTKTQKVEQNQRPGSQVTSVNQLSAGKQDQQQMSIEDLRMKCRELLYQALADPSQCQEKVQEYGNGLEESIHTLYIGNEKKYRSCIRSKISNLKNPKNMHLKKLIYSGTLSPKTFAGMSAMEMASEELRDLRASYTQAGVQEHQLPQRADGVQTSQIKCKKCERFNCTITMISRGTLFLPGWVRSGNPDEEMMTFAICNECGEQWYHSGWICL